MYLKKTVKLNPEEYGQLINIRTAWQYLGYGDTEPDEMMQQEMEQCKARILPVLQPAFQYDIVQVVSRSSERVTLGWAEECSLLQGKSIAEHLEACTAVACVALTLGAGVDALLEKLQQESMLAALLCDALANATAEELRLYAEAQIMKELPDMQKNWLFGIGYGDLELSMQPSFLKALDTKQLGLDCNEKGVLVPMKSVTGFLGLSGINAKLRGNPGAACGKQSCKACTNVDCNLRRT